MPKDSELLFECHPLEHAPTSGPFIGDQDKHPDIQRIGRCVAKLRRKAPLGLVTLLMPVVILSLYVATLSDVFVATHCD